MQSSDGIVSKPENLPFNHVTYAIEVATTHGVDVWPCLEPAGLVAAVREAGISEVSRTDYYRFIEHILDHAEIPAFGLKVGQKFGVADYGVLGYAFISSSTLGDALRTFLRFQQIAGSDGAFREELRVEGDAAIIQVYSNQVRADLYRFEVEEAVGQWSATDVVQQGGKPLAFSKVHFTFARPDYAGLLQEELRCPVFFEQPIDEVYFPKDLLGEHFSMANELTTQICAQQCETLLKCMQSQGGLVEDVRRLIINRPGETPNPEDVARRLHISNRTLRRRLNEEGTSFKDIHNEIRMGTAQEYLRQTELSIQEIAYLLGYSEVSNFHRAFKTWSQQTPGDYREVANGG